MKSKKKIFRILFAIFLMINLSLYGVFGEYKPLAITNGFIQVIILDKEYYEIQEYPKIMIANKDTNLLAYMKDKGRKYVETSDENKLVMENIHEFKYKDLIQYVEVTDHKNYYIWKWRE
ncbi:hypothetical protein [uncultured Anaerococcus sp.]|uniref:hypothetical protein n=1 Tax=uncultured Anaerococcus sp. TaxID=293428 RepID=UPI00288A18E0|nr:hypothetical protein [uncultured Anaerococcus sp.]